MMKPRYLVLCVCLLLLARAAFSAAPPGPQPVLVLQNGHPEAVVSVAFSADGSQVATGSMDGSAKIWDAATGKVLATLRGHEWGARTQIEASPFKHSVTSVAFSPDGRTLATGGFDKTARLWDIATATQRATLSLESDSNSTLVAFSPDGKSLATGNQGVKVWDLATSQVRFSAPDLAVDSLGFSPDGAWLAASANNGGVLLWDARSGKPEAKKIAEFSQEVYTAFSPDSKMLAAGGQQGHLRLLEVPSGKVLAELTEEHYIRSVAFGPQGNLVAVSRSRKSGVLLYDVRHPGSSVPLETQGVVYAVSFSPDGKTLAVAEEVRTGTAPTEGGIVEMFDMTAPQPSLRLRLSGHSRNVNALLFSPDGQKLISGSSDHTAKIWDLSTGRLRTVLEGHQMLVSSVAVAPDGRHLASGGGDGVRLWDLQSGQSIWSAGKADDPFLREAFTAVSPDGRWVAAANGSGYLTVMEAASGHVAARVQASGYPIFALAISPDSREIAVGTYQAEGSVWSLKHFELNRGTLVPVCARQTSLVESVAYSPDGRWVAAATYGQVLLWDNQANQAPRAVTMPKGDTPLSLAFSADGSTLAAGTEKGQLLLYDMATGKSQWIAAGTSLIPAVAFSPDGRLVATGGEAINFWDARSGAALVTAVELDGGREWVVTSPNGLFDGSSGGQRLIEWRLGDKTYALEQFFNGFYTPGLLARALHLTDARPVPVPADISRIKPPPRVRIASPQSGDQIAGDSVEVKIAIQEQGGGASGPSLYVNGHRLPTSRGTRDPDGWTFSVPLEPGSNRVRATAFSEDGTVESRGDVISVLSRVVAARKPVLHVLAVGLDRYQNGLKLGFARADAEAIAGYFKPGLFDAVKVTTLLDDRAGRAAILGALRDLEKNAAPHDAVLIYLAGHGTMVGEVFYFLPYDVRITSDEDIRSTGISSTELSVALSDIRATKAVVILDACHAGGATAGLERLVATRDAVDLVRAQQRLARSSGTFLIAATTEQQQAKEISDLGHGVLTYAILRGLGDRDRPAVPANADGQVTVNALLAYLSEAVPQLVERYHAGRQDIVQFSTGQDFPLVVVPRR